MKKYDIASQLQYSGVAYRTKSGKPRGATIKSGGCGPSSVRNLGNNLLGWKNNYSGGRADRRKLRRTIRRGHYYQHIA